jgi:hypothetical protein
MEWSQAKRTSGPSIQPVYTYTLLLVSLVATLGILGFRYMRVWTPLERHYLPAYLGSQLAGVVRDNGSYTMLQVVTRKGSRLALDSDVVPAMSKSGENTFALTEEAVEHGALRLGLHRAFYKNAEIHAYLGNLIYQNQTLKELVRPALWGGLVLFFAGLLPATYLDRRRSFALRYEKRPRGSELTTGVRSNRPQSSLDMGVVSKLHTMLNRMLGLNKKVHVPLGKDNPRALTMKAALPQEPSKIATAAAETDDTPQSSGARQTPTPPEQPPIQKPEFEHAVRPTARRFFE